VTRTIQWAVVAVLASVVVIGVAIGGDRGDPAIAVAERLACPVCDGESVAASQTEVARSMLTRIRALDAEGLSESEILDWFEARYGPEIVLDPPLDLGGILLWAIPALVAVGGVAVVIRLRARSVESVAVGADPADPPGSVATVEPAPENRRLDGRAVAGLAIVAVGLVAAAFAIGSFLEPRAAGTPISGDIVAPTDLESISDETLAATIASFADDPDVPSEQLNGMRLALAERYFEAGDFRSATTVFQDVLAGEPTAPQASEALGRLGWVLWVNGEADAAEAALGRAIDTFDGNGEARYFLAMILLDLERGAEAVPLLEALAADPTVPGELQPEIEAMLEAARAAA
jgi:cytochrome c-type biogenesis protein CcmH